VRIAGENYLPSLLQRIGEVTAATFSGINNSVNSVTGLNKGSALWRVAAPTTKTPLCIVSP
jgi:hypothetical protein